MITLGAAFDRLHAPTDWGLGYATRLARISHTIHGPVAFGAELGVVALDSAVVER
jgi:hypothetical protein